jgi:Ca2+-binding RTX toxin-like protein
VRRARQEAGALVLRRLVLVLAFALLVPASAHAGTFSKQGSTLLYTGTDADEQLSGYSSGTKLIFSTFPVGTTWSGDSTCALNLGNIECSTIGFTRYEARGLGGADRFYGMGVIPATLDGGAGADILDGAGLADTLLGGEGDDWLRGADGNDNLQGGSGADRLEGGPGAGGSDTYSGGDGVDVVNYVYATAGVTATIDGVANDGQPGEADNVLTDVENLWGSNHADALTGSAGANSLEGGLQNDTITGLGGRDELFGEEGNDTIFARDGVGEPVECGDGVDTAQVDVVDGEPSECETVDPSNALQPDLDGDGVDRPADCDDGNPARRPGLLDVPENAVDEDCSGADAPQLDRDADGFPVPRDCDDGNAAIKPGAREVPGNRADENCDGRAPGLPRVGVDVSDAWNATGRSARVARMELDGVKRRTAVAMRCQGKGCAFKRRTVKAKGRTLDLRGALAGTRLRKGTVLELRITRAGTLGSVVRFTGRGRGIPSRRDLCVSPGGKPGACR